MFLCFWILVMWLTNWLNDTLSLRVYCAQGTLRSSIKVTKVGFKRQIQRCTNAYRQAQSGWMINVRAHEFRRPFIYSSVYLFSHQMFPEDPFYFTHCPIHWQPCSHITHRHAGRQAIHTNTYRHMASQSQVLVRWPWLGQGGHTSLTGVASAGFPELVMLILRTRNNWWLTAWSGLLGEKGSLGVTGITQCGEEKFWLLPALFQFYKRSC